MTTKGASNLSKYISGPLKQNIGQRLESYLYYDIYPEDELMTNNNGIDIISHQLELKFEGNNPIFISWATIEGWFQYSLCVSETSFCKGVESYAKQDENWTKITGKKLEKFEVFGYKQNTITSTNLTSSKVSTDTYTYEPHLLLLYFQHNQLLAVANFYSEKTFIPTLPTGDDVWIIFDHNHINNCISRLSLELLDI